MSTMQLRTSHWVSLGLLGLLAIIALVIFRPVPQLQPNVIPVRLLGYGAATQPGQRVARVQVRNVSPRSIRIWAPATLHLKRSGENYTSDITVVPGDVPRGGTSVIEVSVPDDAAWQLWLRIGYVGARHGTVVYSDWYEGFRP